MCLSLASCIHVVVPLSGTTRCCRPAYRGTRVHIVAHLAEVGQDGVCIRLHHCQAPVSSDGSYQNRFGDLWGRDMHRLVVHVRANLRKGRCQPMALDATLAEGAPHKFQDSGQVLKHGAICTRRQKVDL